jgi:hypothetical protein
MENQKMGAQEMSAETIAGWYAGHVDADTGDHAWYLENGVCGCCGVTFTRQEKNNG